MIIDKCNLRDAANNRFPILSLSLSLSGRFPYTWWLFQTLIRGTNDGRDLGLKSRKFMSWRNDGLYSPRSLLWKVWEVGEYRGIFFSIPLFFEYYPYPLVDKCFLGFDLIDDNNHSSDVKHWIQTDTHWMRVMLHWIVVYT